MFFVLLLIIINYSKQLYNIMSPSALFENQARARSKMLKPNNVSPLLRRNTLTACKLRKIQSHNPNSDELVSHFKGWQGHGLTYDAIHNMQYDNMKVRNML